LRGVSPGAQGRKIAAHATPSVTMVKYYTMAPSAATAKFFFPLSPQAAQRPGVCQGRSLYGDMDESVAIPLSLLHLANIVYREIQRTLTNYTALGGFSNAV